MDLEFKLTIILVNILLIMTSFFAGVTVQKTFGNEKIQYIEVKNAK